MTAKTKTIVKRIIASMNLPLKNYDLLIFGKAVFKAMSGNTNFTTSAAKVTTLGTDVAALDAAITACQTKPPTSSVDARNVILEMVKADLRALRNDVQTVADANPSKAESIITSAAMSIKKPTNHSKQQNKAVNGAEEGSVKLTAEGPGPHEWRDSTDGITWKLLPSSASSKTIVRNLVSGTVYYFQNRRILPRGVETEWSQSVKIRVN